MMSLFPRVSVRAGVARCRIDRQKSGPSWRTFATSATTIDLGKNSVHVFDPQTQISVPVSGRWLRDNCSCSQCRNQATGQRQINIFKNDINGTISNITSQGDQFEATFEDGHKSSFQKSFLLSRQTRQSERLRHGHEAIQVWTAKIADNPPTVLYNRIRKGDGLKHLLRKIKKYGFAFVDEMPATPEATQSLIEQIGPIRNTHYGAFYDFTNDLSSKDTAYTAEALEPHTDTTYFTEPIGIQALHLLSHTDGSGGLSSLVDGFSAAFQLKQRYPAYYETLSKVGVYAHASGNEGVSIQPALPQPVFSHYPPGHPLEGGLMQVRWNNADRAGIATSFGKIDDWYNAASKFDEILSSEENQYWFQLKAGKCLFFDNWRALHGRSEFTGKRRMCGGYVNRDDFISKLRLTNLQPEEITASTVTG